MLAQQSSQTDLQAAISTLISQQKQAQKEPKHEPAKKVSADDFDKYDSSTEARQMAKQEAGVLDQAA